MNTFKNSFEPVVLVAAIAQVYWYCDCSNPWWFSTVVDEVPAPVVLLAPVYARVVKP
jgi:hypothetical protein